MSTASNVNMEVSSVNPKKSQKFKKVFHIVLTIFVLLVFAFLIVPILVVIPMSFSSDATLKFPPSGFSLQWYEAFFQDSKWFVALRTSFIVALSSSILSLILGMFAAYGLTRSRFKGKKIILANMMAPMIIPQIITAVGLYLFFAKIGLVGTIPGLIIGHTILSAPFVILIMMLGISSVDVRVEQASRSLGATWLTSFTRVILPNIIPSVLSSWFFAFIVSFDELIVTIFLSGPHVTAPKKMFDDLMIQINPVITVVSTLLIIFTLGIVAVALLVLRKYKDRLRIRG